MVYRLVMTVKFRPSAPPPLCPSAIYKPLSTSRLKGSKRTRNRRAAHYGRSLSGMWITVIAQQSQARVPRPAFQVT